MNVEEIMNKVQEFASTWAVVDGRFDDGTAMERAEQCKAEIRTMLAGCTALDEQKAEVRKDFVHWAAFEAGAVFCGADQGEPECWQFETAQLESFARDLLSKYAAPVNEQDVLTALDEQSTAITGWHGWACQYPGRFPRFYGAKAIAELNHDPDNGDRLFHVAEVQEDAQPVTSAPAVPLEIIDALNAATGSNEWQWEHSPAELVDAACAAIARLTAPAPKVVIGRDALVDLIAEHLSGTYHCTRVWSAWSYGTMGPDDFEDVGESSTPGEIADAILDRFAAPAPKGEPVAYLIDWPGEPDLGYYFAENPTDSGRCRPLYTEPVNEQDAKDAQRYRAWRKAATRDDRRFLEAATQYESEHFLGRNPTEDEFDAGIDAAVAAIAQQGKEKDDE